MTTEIVAVDIGGTHARFAIAIVEHGRIVELSHETTLKAAEYASLQTARDHFAEVVGRPLPTDAGIALAGPVQGEVLQLTNNPWVIRPALIPEKLGFTRYVLVNDFGAVSHAVAHLGPDQFRHLTGPDVDLPTEGVVSVVGPGTGLGVGMLVSLLTPKLKTDEELKGLVYSLTPKPPSENEPWYEQPVTLGIIVLACTVALNFIFA